MELARSLSEITPSRPMRSQSGCEMQASELFWSLASPMAIGSQNLSSQAVGPST